MTRKPRDHQTLADIRDGRKNRAKTVPSRARSRRVCELCLEALATTSDLGLRICNDCLASLHQDTSST